MAVNRRSAKQRQSAQRLTLHPERDGRGLSTVFDAVLFVLLVGVAVAVLAGVQPATPTTDRVAEETGDVLSTSTATVSYSWSAPVRVDGETEPMSVDRRAHGTYAELLAAATTTNPRWGTQGTTGTGASLTRAVETATGRVLPTRTRAVQVNAVWRPFPGSTLEGVTVVGERPPPDASVSAATMTVPSGFPNVTGAALRAGRRGDFHGVANATATGVVRGLFPLGPTADAFRSEGPDRALATERYRWFGEILGVDLSAALESGDVERANDALASALARELVADLHERYDSAATAARSVSVHEVTIVVRTWSP